MKAVFYNPMNYDKRLPWHVASFCNMAQQPRKPHDPTISSFDALPACDGRTDTLPAAMSRSSRAEADKNGVQYRIVGFNVPLDTLYAISETVLRVT